MHSGDTSRLASGSAAKGADHQHGEADADQENLGDRGYEIEHLGSFLSAASSPPAGARLGNQLIDRGGHRLEKQVRIDAHQQDQQDQRRERRHLVRPQIADRPEMVLDQSAEDHPAIQPEHVGRAQDHAGCGEQRDPGVHLEHPDDHHDLADEAGGPGQTDRGEHEQHEHRGIDRHALGEAAVGRDLARVDAVVDHADHHEQRPDTKPWLSIWMRLPWIPSGLR